jgi:multidrug efflux pump subunit AcrA (membrane-fusion protein)
LKRRPRKKTKFRQYARSITTAAIVLSVAMLFVWPYLRSALLKILIPVGRGYAGTLENHVKGTALFSGGSTLIVAPVDGTLNLQVKDNESVRVGQVLATIGDSETGAEFADSIAKARGNLASYEAETEQEFALLKAEVQEAYRGALESLLMSRQAFASGDAPEALAAESSLTSLEEIIREKRERLSSIEDQRGNLARTVALLEQALTTSKVNVLSPSAGVFSSEFTEAHKKIPGMSLSDKDASEIMALCREIKDAIEIRVEDGGSVKIGDPVGRVITGEDISFYLPVKTEERPALRQGQSVVLRLPDGTEMRSTVTSVVDARPPGYSIISGTIDVVSSRIGTGSAEVTLVASRNSGTVIPTASILEMNGETGVLIVQKTYARFAPVEILAAHGDRTVVRGISETHEIVLRPKAFLEGRRVR